MKHPLFAILFGAALVSTAVSLLVVSLSTPGGSGARADSVARPATAPSDPLAAFEARVASLEKENDELRLRLSTLESRPRVIVSEREPVEPVAATGLDAESATGVAAAEGITGAVPEGFVSRVDLALQEIRTREEVQREEALAAQRAERIEDRLVELSEELGLSSYQVDEMRTYLTDQETRRSALWQSMSDGSGDRTSIRDGMRALRSEAEETLSTILDPDQLASYQESQGGFRGGFGGRGGADGGGRNRGGGRNGG